jgi:hypothetical protein
MKEIGSRRILLGAGMVVILCWGFHRDTHARPVHASEPQKAWVIYSDGDVTVTKIQDRDCSLYVVTPAAGGVGGTKVSGIATGQGCK